MTAAALRTAVLVALAAVLFVAVTPFGPGFSSAAFTAQTVNSGNRIGAAADWTPPTVSVRSSATPLRDIATITADASDAETGVRDVVISVQAAGATTWTTLCTKAVAPYSCSWDTRTVADGSYSLRAVATDNSSYVTTSALVPATVGNTVGVTLADPGDAVRGTVALPTTLTNTGAGPYTVRVEYAVADSEQWKTLCTTAVAPYSCAWVTTGIANDFYDLRSVVTAPGVAATVSPVVEAVLVDNAAPSITMADPGSPLRGTVTLTATATDDHSGVTAVTIQYAPNGSSSWQTACSIVTSPYSCRFDTTKLAGGSYSFRATAADAAGNAATSGTVGGRTVDNSVASVAVEDPGAFLSGTAILTATAASTAGVASVAIQVAPSGTSSWTTVCSDASTPYTCAWNTKTVADGLYDLRAVLTDSVGTQTTSAILTQRRVDNRPLRGLDVQMLNGSSSVGRLQTGDMMTFTYSAQVNPASITSGWNGAALPVTLRLRDGNLLGTGSMGDTVDIQRSGAVVNLGSVNLKGDYVRLLRTTTFAATMTATTATVNGLPVTVVTINLGAVATSGGSLRTAATSANAVWTPSALATDLSGSTSSTTPVTESGALDKEF
ncbi:hypothetical protein ASD56_04290 [Microbacterium sp. Root166]|uniref:Ig-like domain-containing protein n=1 Tax=Microbacterium sp. Root166 TaxID=1736478 RepID=UPI0006F8F87D|nr:Ig-like domain-containing protein [Microbacterium sp. Root166]KQZ85544.1 hypothetical protein ASD56_04290 [Microbacterium sp. Root166]